MNVAALISGGKDSALALYRALQSGYNVKYLVTMIPLRSDSWMFHFPNIRLTELFAKAVEIPLVKTDTSGVKEKELEDLEGLLRTLNVEGIVSGGISSQYQKTRIDEICRKLSMRSITPLWHEDPIKLMNEIINLGFYAIITGVYAYGLGQSWLGRTIDNQSLNDLIELNRKFQVSIVGEGGEYESLVLDAPYFVKKIQILKARIVWEGSSGYLLVEDASLQTKNNCRMKQCQI